MTGASVSMRLVSFNGDTTKYIFFYSYLQKQSFNRSLDSNSNLVNPVCTSGP